MNKLVALMLLFAVPAFAQQQVSLTPSAEHAEPLAAVEAAEESAVPWKPLVIGGAAVTAAVVIAVIVSVVLRAQAAKPLDKSDFGCNPQCDGWLNEPSK